MLDPLYAAQTRPARFAKITLAAFMLCLLGTAAAVCIAMLLTKYGLLFGVVFIPLYSFCRIVESEDPRAFQLLGLWMRTKGKSISNRFFWGGYHAGSPFERRRY